MTSPKDVCIGGRRRAHKMSLSRVICHMKNMAVILVSMLFNVFMFDMVLA